MKTKLLTKFDTVHCADSVEWCPIQPFQRLFVCGNYDLEEDKSNGTSDLQRNRFGRILLFEYKDGLQQLQTIDTAAVLDQKWCNNLVNDKIVLAVTTAQATLDVYTLKDLKLNKWLSYKFSSNEKERLLLSVDWSTGKYESKEPYLVVSDNQGNVHLFHLLEDSLILVNTWQLHSHEAWISAFDYWDPKFIFSGADDMTFIKTNTETGVHIKNHSHECGVTSMHSNARREYVFATGSYDAFMRIWDTRMMKAPQDSIEMPGPVWRVKWDPFEHDHLVTACMDGGVSLVEASGSSLAIVDNFKEHESIAYGADWCHAKDVQLLVTCSFYDHLLCVASY